jgi:hypothetical protein
MKKILFVSIMLFAGLCTKAQVAQPFTATTAQHSDKLSAIQKAEKESAEKQEKTKEKAKLDLINQQNLQAGKKTATPKH